MIILIIIRTDEFTRTELDLDRAFARVFLLNVVFLVSGTKYVVILKYTRGNFN